jgi:hypothetical protein
LIIYTTIDVPIKVADQYSHKLFNTPESKAGANERAGFIDAPEINAKKKISNPTIPPIAIPPNPLKPLVYTTKKITAIRRADANTSIPKTIGTGKLKLGAFAPRLALNPIVYFTNRFKRVVDMSLY